MEHITVVSHSAEQTQQLGRQCSCWLGPGDCVPLIGELGSGKTCFVKGIARGLGVPDEMVVNSPSFTLINRYEARIPLYHADLYRLESECDVDDLELMDIVYGDGITVIEWPQLILSRLPVRSLSVEFFWDMTAENRRVLTFTGPVKRFQKFFEWLHDENSRH